MNICVHVSLYEYVPMCMDMCVCLNEYVYMYVSMYVVCKSDHHMITSLTPAPGTPSRLPAPTPPQVPEPPSCLRAVPCRGFPSCILGGPHQPLQDKGVASIPRTVQLELTPPRDCHTKSLCHPDHPHPDPLLCSVHSQTLPLHI